MWFSAENLVGIESTSIYKSPCVFLTVLKKAGD